MIEFPEVNRADVTSIKNKMHIILDSLVYE